MSLCLLSLSAKDMFDSAVCLCGILTVCKQQYSTVSVYICLDRVSLIDIIYVFYMVSMNDLMAVDQDDVGRVVNE